jgi:2,4-dienoyl-CoA reductase-like NADH-dependent reductase (Old Yellow Enzyme family)
MNLPHSDNISILAKPIQAGAMQIPNRLVIQPMEGRDSTPDGSPGELTIRRYKKLAGSGAGLLWFEAVALSNEARANKGQLFLSKENVGEYAKLLSEYKQLSAGMPVILQITHSGRHTKRDGVLHPVIAHNNPLFEKTPLSEDCIITDDELKQLEESYVEATKLSIQAGFDGIDIKACHGYLLSELHAAFTRKGSYGGDFENRTRLIRNAVAAAKSVAPQGFIVTTRMNIYDAYPYPYGFGVTQDDTATPDLSEPIELIKQLDLDLVNITMGNPYYNPHVNRPIDIEGVVRIYGLTGRIQAAFPELPVILSGPTFMREKSAQYSAGAIEQGVCSLVGFGRMSWAYPEFAKDMISGNLDKKQICVTCGKCTQLMRAGGSTGCAIRDPIYTKLLKETFPK